MRPLFFASILALAGCAAGSPHTTQFDGGPDAQFVWPDSGTDAGVRDAGSMDASSMDAGSIDSGSIDGGSTDAGQDAGPLAMDAGTDAGTASVDAGTDAGSTVIDGGPPSITVDGVIDADEWVGAEEGTSTTATEWAGDELRRLLATVRDGRLYVAIEGTIEGNNAMVVYVDNHLGDAAGVASLGSLMDASGSLDDAISAGFATPSSFLADYAWGTQDLSRAASGFDDRMGWRDIAVADASNFAWVDSAEAPTVCGAAACETSIPLATLGGTSPRRIVLFARITNHDGMASPNQTLPMDDPSNPRTVMTVLSVTE